jgi:hypothetical protein
MDNVYEYYDNIADISFLAREAIKSLEATKKEVQLALKIINRVKKYNGDTAISPTSNATAHDIYRDLLFFELLLNQTHGVTNTLTFKELLELTNYSVNEEEF